MKNPIFSKTHIPRQEDVCPTSHVYRVNNQEFEKVVRKGVHTRKSAQGARTHASFEVSKPVKKIEEERHTQSCISIGGGTLDNTQYLPMQHFRSWNI